MIRLWFKSGTPFIWLNAGAVSISLVAVFGLLILILVRGMSHFWPANVEAFHYQNTQNEITVIAEIVESEIVPADAVPRLKMEKGNIERFLVKTGNRDILGSDFRWLYDVDLKERNQPKDIMVLERIEWGNFYGYLNAVFEGKKEVIREGNVVFIEKNSNFLISTHQVACVIGIAVPLRCW